ncbi:MAG: sulfite exporter TauE/SafE family protein, partial [Bacteroidota bacterium]
VGAGGGFLIIPALVLLAKLPMKMAVGTSLSIITIKSLIGFVGDINAGQEIDWPFLLIFSGLTIVGILVGGYLSNFIPGKKLKSGFGWFVLVMAAYILMKELVL